MFREFLLRLAERPAGGRVLQYALLFPLELIFLFTPEKPAVNQSDGLPKEVQAEQQDGKSNHNEHRATNSLEHNTHWRIPFKHAVHLLNDRIGMERVLHLPPLTAGDGDAIRGPYFLKMSLEHVATRIHCVNRWEFIQYRLFLLPMTGKQRQA